jgi:hypothetical protein
MHLEFKIITTLKCKLKGYSKYMRIFDPHATWVKNPFRQIEYELFFIMFFMIFCMSDCVTTRLVVVLRILE